MGGKTSDFKLKQHHHIKLDAEFKSDCMVWVHFLNSRSIALNRPMVDLLKPEITSRDIAFFSDASAAESLACGFGCVLGTL